MKLIAIETSTENCSVALLHNGQVNSRDAIAPQKHAELVLGYMDDLLLQQDLKKHEIEGIVFGQGPGAFTGVRIAMSVVQGLALAWDVPVVAISTLHNMAFQVWQKQTEKKQNILIANDARMGEIYWATFACEHGQLSRISDDSLNPPEDIKTTGFDVCAGSAFQRMIKTESCDLVLPEILPDASTLLAMAGHNFTSKAQHINQIRPSYVREKVVFN